MHTSNPEIQLPPSGRRRGRYSEDFKRQVVAKCQQPGVSTAAVALANGLNANVLRRWVVESAPQSGSRRSKTTALAAPAHNAPTFIAVKLAPPPLAPVPPSATPPADIRLQLQHGTTTVHIHWPLQASCQCAQWLREVLA